MKKNTPQSVKKNAQSSYYNFLPSMSTMTSSKTVGILESFEDTQNRTSLSFVQTTMPDCKYSDQQFSLLLPQVLEALKQDNYHQSLSLRSYKIDLNKASQIGVCLKSNQSLTSLEMGECGLDAQSLGTILEGLQYNSHLKSLNLGGNGFGDEGALKVAYFLPTNHSLTSMRMGGNKISTAGAESVMQALKYNTTIQSINFRDNPFGIDKKYATAIKNSLTPDAYKDLDLVLLSKYLSGDITHANAMSSGVETIERDDNLQTQFNKLSHVGHAESFKDGVHWTPSNISIRADGVKVERSEVPWLIGGKNITKVSYSYHYPPEKQLDPLRLESYKDSKNPTSLRFNSSNEQFLPQMLPELSGDSYFTSLNLNLRVDCGVAKQLRDCLKKNKHLTSIEIADSNLKENALKILLQGLEHNNNIINFKLIGSNFHHGGQKMITDFLKGDHALTSMKTGHGDILITGNVKPSSFDNTTWSRDINTIEQGDHLSTGHTYPNTMNFGRAENLNNSNVDTSRDLIDFGDDASWNNSNVDVSGANNSGFDFNFDFPQ